MPKWYATMPALAKKCWETFFTTLESTSSFSTEEDDCQILNLKCNIKRPRNTMCDETADIPSQILELREKELEPLEEVCNCLIFLYIVLYITNRIR